MKMTNPPNAKPPSKPPPQSSARKTGLNTSPKETLFLRAMDRPFVDLFAEDDYVRRRIAEVSGRKGVAMLS
jgi:hypothetical protein